MKTAFARCMAGISKLGVNLLLFGGIVCALPHLAHAQNVMSKSAGDGQSVTVGTPSSIGLQVSFSNPSTTVTVQWQVVSGSATLIDSYGAPNGTDITDSNISTSSPLDMGFQADAAGPIQITATCQAGCSVGAPLTVTFNINATGAPSNTMSIAAGNNQSVAIGDYSTNLSVVFTGGPSVTLNWQVISGNATIYDGMGPQPSGVTHSLATTAGSVDSITLLMNSPGPVTVAATCSQGCDTLQVLTFNANATPPQPQLKMQVDSGSGQSGAANSALANPLVVNLTPSTAFLSGSSANIDLDWSIESGTATFGENDARQYTQNVVLTSPAHTQSAEVHVNLGDTPGPVVVAVSCSACDAGAVKGFRLTITPSASSALTIVSGNNQTGNVGSAAALPLVVNDSTSSVTSIQWSVTAGDATLAATSSTRDANGNASMTFTYGTASGPVTIHATDGTASVDFNATALVAGTASIVSGDNQSGIVGSALLPLVIQVATGSGTGVSQIPVIWTVTAGGGSLAAASNATDADGRASNTLMLGTTPGANTVTASLPGGVVLTFHAQALPGGSVVLTKTSGDQQTATTGTTLQPFVVDAGVAGINVSWTLVQGDGHLQTANTLTDSNGRTSNTFTLGTQAGSNVVQAQIAGASPVTFTAIASAVINADVQFSIVSGDHQLLLPNRQSDPLVVQLRDAQGEPINGAAIAWSVSGSSGSLAKTGTLTGSNGQSQNQVTVILPGDYTVTAKLVDAPDVAPLTFTFGNGVANLPNLSPLQIQVAKVIDRACTALAGMPPDQLTPAQKDFFLRCSELVVGADGHRDQVPTALKRLLNNKALPQQGLSRGVRMGQLNNVNSRMTHLRQGASGVSLSGLSLVNDGQSLPLAMLGDLLRKDAGQSDEIGKDFSRWGFFATGMIARGEYNANSARPGFDYHNASLTAGVDYRFNDAFVAGLALGYNQNRSSLEQDLGKLDADAYSLAGYFTWYHNDDFYVEGSLMFDWLNYDLSRNIAYQFASTTPNATTTIDQNATASPDGRISSLALSLGRDFHHKAWAASTYLRGEYSHLNFGAYSEQASSPDAPGIGLMTSVDSRSVNSLLGVVGGRFSYTTSHDWGVLIPTATLEWNHEFRNDPQTVVTRFIADPTQTPIIIRDQPQDPSYFNVGLGLNAIFPGGRSGFVSWEHIVGLSGTRENRFSLGIRIEF